MRGRDDSPHDHDARDPEAGADPFQDQVRRHLEEKVTDEEDAGPSAIDRGAETEVDHHLLLGEADVHAIEERRHEAHAQKRHQLPRDLGHQALFGGFLFHAAHSRKAGGVR